MSITLQRVMEVEARSLDAKGKLIVSGGGKKGDRGLILNSHLTFFGNTGKRARGFATYQGGKEILARS